MKVNINMIFLALFSQQAKWDIPIGGEIFKNTFLGWFPNVGTWQLSTP